MPNYIPNADNTSTPSSNASIGKTRRNKKHTRSSLARRVQDVMEEAGMAVKPIKTSPQAKSKTATKPRSLGTNAPVQRDAKIQLAARQQQAHLQVQNRIANMQQQSRKRLETLTT